MIVALQLDEDMESMARLKDGMKIKAHVLEVCRVMVRAEKAEHRLAILKIIQVLPHSAEAVMRVRSQRASGRVLLCVVLCCVVLCVQLLVQLELSCSTVTCLVNPLCVSMQKACFIYCYTHYNKGGGWGAGMLESVCLCVSFVHKIAFQLLSYTHHNKVGCVFVYGEKRGEYWNLCMS